MKIYYKTRNRKSKKKKIIKGENNNFKDLGLSTHIQQKITGNNNYIENGVGANLSNTKIIIIGNNNKIIIKSGTYIDSSSIWLQGNNCALIIGKSVSVESASFAIVEDNQSIEIGDNCMLSYEIDMKTSDSHSIIDLESNKRINKAQSIRIGNHVWIGAKVSILKGVQIGDDSIIGTGSIVTKSIPSSSIAVGIPAKVVRSNITWDRQLI